MQPLHSLGNALMLVVYSGASNEQVSPCLHDQRGCCFVNTTIDLYVAMQVPLDNHLAHTRNFGQCLRYEFLAAKAGIDSHYQHQVEEGEHVVEHEDGRRRIQGYASHFPGCFDLVNNAVQVRTNFLVHDDNVCSGHREMLYVLFRVGNHQMGFERETGTAAHSFDNHGSHSDIGHEVPVHDIDLNTLGSCRLCLAHLFSQAGKVG